MKEDDSCMGVNCILFMPFLLQLTTQRSRSIHTFLVIPLSWSPIVVVVMVVRIPPHCSSDIYINLLAALRLTRRSKIIPFRFCYRHTAHRVMEI